MANSFSDKVNELSYIREIVQPDNEDRVEFESQSFHDWYEYWGAACDLADLSTTGWLEFTDRGREVIEEAYQAFQDLIRMPEGEVPFPDEEWREQEFLYQPDYPFNSFDKPIGLISIP
jgi:hypothetical protein